jgi:hypothetical protein
MVTTRCWAGVLANQATLHGVLAEAEALGLGLIGVAGRGGTSRGTPRREAALVR